MKISTPVYSHLCPVTPSLYTAPSSICASILPMSEASTYEWNKENCKRHSLWGWFPNSKESLWELAFRRVIYAASVWQYACNTEHLTFHVYKYPCMAQFSHFFLCVPESPGRLYQACLQSTEVGPLSKTSTLRVTAQGNYNQHFKK